MTDTLRLLERIHGHLAWLSAAALLHPVVVLRTATRRALFACASGSILATLTAAFGTVIYADYRRTIRRPLFVEAPRLGWAFERKEHFAAGVVLLAWAAFFAHVASRQAADPAARDALWRTARAGYFAAFLLAAAAGVTGLLVASRMSF